MPPTGTAIRATKPADKPIRLFDGSEHVAEPT
jgi:hypothetical protein